MMEPTKAPALDGVEPHGWMCIEATTLREWLDENRHVNVQYYFRLIAQAMSEFMECTLCGGARPDPPPLFFSLEMHIFYRAELMAGERVRVYVLPLSRTEKVLRVLTRIYRIGGNSERNEANGGNEATLSAECIWKGAYVDSATRRVRPLGDEAKALYDAKLAEAEGKIEEPKIYPPGLILPPPLPGKEIISTEGEVQPGWIDQMGHMNIEYYMRIFNFAAGGYFRGLGFDLEVMRRNRWGAFGMGSLVKYLREMKAGEKYIVKTAAISLQRKTATYRHTIYAADGVTECATSDHVSCFVDWDTRRAIPLPEMFKAKMAEIHGVDIGALG